MTKTTAVRALRPVAAAAAPLPAAMTTTAPEVLRIAAETIVQRGAQRDSQAGGGAAPAERSMAATVAAFNALEGTSLSEAQGWRFMQVLKLARAATSERNGVFNSDDYVDGSAYGALGHEAAERAAMAVGVRG
jgi:hypothetical protein